MPGKILAQFFGCPDRDAVDLRDDVPCPDTRFVDRGVLLDGSDLSRIRFGIVRNSQHKPAVRIRAISQVHLLPVPQDRHTDIPVGAVIMEDFPCRHIPADIHVITIVGNYEIPGLKARCLGGTALRNIQHLRRVIADYGQHDDGADKRKQEVEQRPSEDDGGTPSDGYAVEGPFFRIPSPGSADTVFIRQFHLRIHAFHFTGAPEKQYLQGIPGAAVYCAEKPRPEAERELLHVHAV